LSGSDKVIRLFGTAEHVAETRKLSAGRLSALLDGGHLRDVRYDNVEIIRGVFFLVRDVEWGTAAIDIVDLKIDEEPTRFAVTFGAKCAGTSGFVYDCRIEGSGSGHLLFTAEGASRHDFLTNRVGFVVLHPLQGVAGQPMTIEHTDGSVETVTMPDLISPIQPAFEVRALSHDAAPGLRVMCRLEGDTFEMEDQRNWTDASFKTYVRPVALPRPFIVRAGARIVQSVTITVSGESHTVSGRSAAGPLTIGECKGFVPAIAIGFELSTDPDADHAAHLDAMKPQRLVTRLDARRDIPLNALRRLKTLQERIGCKQTLELVLPALNPDAEIAEVAEAVADTGLSIDAVVATGAYDLKMRPSNNVPVDAATPTDLIKAARRSFPDAMIGGGVLSGFPEFNQNPPPPEADFVTHTTSAIVHAADDRSVMETIEALPSVFASAKALGRNCPYRVGPSGIGMRINPAGSATAANPHGIRIPMASSDPRQDGLFGAAWTLAYITQAVASSVDEVALADVSGSFGVLGHDGELRPIFHVLRGFAGLAGAPARRVFNMPCGVAALASDGPMGTELWLANLMGTETELTINGSWQAAVLDTETFFKAQHNPAFLETFSPVTSSVPVAPYAVMRLRQIAG